MAPIITRACWIVVVGLLLQACTTPSQKGNRAGYPISPHEVRAQDPQQYNTQPFLVSGDAPIYPITQLFARKSGESLIEYTVDEEGTTKSFKILQAENKSYANHAIIAVKAWHFRPATKNGSPVAAVVVQRFTYGIQ